VFKFQNDRFIPSRGETIPEFLKKSPNEYFDIIKAENSMSTMKKVEYQNHIRKLFVESQEENKRSRKRKKPIEIKLVHEDWACKLSAPRSNFFPDFETMKKPGFGCIGNCLWFLASIRLNFVFL
jgi:hypothetical protein